MAHRNRSVLPVDSSGSGRTTPRRSGSSQVAFQPPAGQLRRTESTRTAATETLSDDAETEANGDKTQVEATQDGETLRSGQSLSAMSSMLSYIGGAQPRDDDEWEQKVAPIRRMESLLGPDWDKPAPETQTTRDIYCDDLRAEVSELLAENDNLRTMNVDLHARLERTLEGEALLRHQLAKERALRIEGEAKLEEVEKAFREVHQTFKSLKRRRSDVDNGLGVVGEREKRTRHD